MIGIQYTLWSIVALLAMLTELVKEDTKPSTVAHRVAVAWIDSYALLIGLVAGLWLVESLIFMSAAKPDWSSEEAQIRYAKVALYSGVAVQTVVLWWLRLRFRYLPGFGLQVG